MEKEKKKVLIITYYFPPAGGPGVQRWLKFVKYLPDFGWKPIVFVPENPTYPIVDQGLLTEVAEDLEIIRQPILEPYQLASVFSKQKTKKISSGIIPNEKKQGLLEKMLLWIRGNIFIPDARFLWVKPSIKTLRKYILENQIDTIITSGPPHSLHLIGLGLKNELTLDWIADFRDPWTTIGYQKSLKLSNYAAKKHQKLEAKVLNTADHILVTSQTTKTDFEKLTNKPITVITNGYDQENVPSQTLDNSFSLAHIGSFLSARNPEILWQSLQEIKQEIPDFEKDLKIKLIGAVSQEVFDAIRRNGLENQMEYLGYVSHQEAVVQQRKSQVLLLIEIDSEETKSIIPGKLFEYMVSDRPILALGPDGCDFSQIIKETNTGVFCHYKEKEKLKQTIKKYYQQYLEEKLVVNAVGLQQYSRKKLTQKLSETLNSIKQK